MKIQKVYIIEYRFYNKSIDSWSSKVSQEGYFRYEDARKFCEEHAGNPGVTEIPRYFQSFSSNGTPEEYYIHEVIIRG